MNALKQVRFNKGMSQYKLSLLATVHQSRISLMENNLVRPRPDEMKRLAKALGVTPQEIWGTGEEGRQQ